MTPMMNFDYTQKRERNSAAQRSVVMGQQGLVVSSQHLATLAGYKILSKGGNAIDAAVAMSSVQNVVEPHSVGIGGDAFALIYLSKKKKMIGMNASGRAPYQADIKWFQERGFKTIPERGILSVTVPGALLGWAQAVERYGRLSLADVFEDAINYAEFGFPVTEVIAGEWKNQKGLLKKQRGAEATYLPNGKTPEPGQIFKSRDLARTYRKIVDEGIETFYEGEICEAITEFCKENGGLLTKQDFQDHSTTWVEPISLDYRGYTVFELPPNGQGLTALEMLNILQGYDIAGMGHNSPEYIHILVEAKKIAYNNRDHIITDPEFENIPVDKILSTEYAQHCREMIDPDKALEPGMYRSLIPGSETVLVTAVDKDRNAVSLISSVYGHFGSGVVVDGTGIVLQNRGKSFSLDPKHLNRLEPHKRTMHTIIPAMLFKSGMFLSSFGVMGGDMQPQGHVQFLANIIDFNMNLQEAVDAPRIRHMSGSEVYLEDGIAPETAAILEKKGHRIQRTDSVINQVGGAQAIFHDHTENVLLGASDRRKDGCAIGY
jgi:gamma-glutamyltranspeptidase / glutathione hydrolase